MPLKWKPGVLSAPVMSAFLVNTLETPLTTQLCSLFMAFLSECSSLKGTREAYGGDDYPFLTRVDVSSPLKGLEWVLLNLIQELLPCFLPCLWLISCSQFPFISFSPDSKGGCIFMHSHFDTLCILKAACSHNPETRKDLGRWFCSFESLLFWWRKLQCLFFFFPQGFQLILHS